MAYRRMALGRRWRLRAATGRTNKRQPPFVSPRRSGHSARAPDRWLVKWRPTVTFSTTSWTLRRTSQPSRRWSARSSRSWHRRLQPRPATRLLSPPMAARTTVSSQPRRRATHFAPPLCRSSPPPLPPFPRQPLSAPSTHRPRLRRRRRRRRRCRAPPPRRRLPPTAAFIRWCPMAIPLVSLFSLQFISPAFTLNHILSSLFMCPLPSYLFIFDFQTNISIFQCVCCF